jgi:beta-lactamase class A
MLARPSRRGLVLGVAASLCAGSALATDPFAAIEAGTGGRLGVAALEIAPGGGRLAHRADERFPMCSTFKVLAVAAALAKFRPGSDRLNRFVRYGLADLLPHSPVTRANVGQGGMRLGDLCAAAIGYSDNTAANLILAQIGGPEGWTRYARALGDGVSRLDRVELGLNAATPGDPRDTTTPNAMLADLHTLTTMDGPGSPDIEARLRLILWMQNCQTGKARLRAGLPASWRVGDKTGTGENGTANDIAIAIPPARSRPAILISSYLTGAVHLSAEARDAVHARVARVVVDSFSGNRSRLARG